MIETGFYLCGILAILYEAYTLTNAKLIQAKVEELKARREANSPLEKLWIWSLFFYAIWCIVGLFSSQWVFFLILLFMSLIPNMGVIHRRTDAAISLLILVFIIVNKFHLKIDVL